MRGISIGVLALVLMPLLGTAQSRSGSVRGIVLDGDFEVPLSLVEVVVAGTELRVETSQQGDFVIPDLEPGRYTLLFRKSGYLRQVVNDVPVQAGELTEVETVRLLGEFTDMEEFVVEDLARLGLGSEGALLDLRFDSPGLLDSIGADLMSKAGASDAAGALRLVSGATVSNGKFAVIRGLPDRYVSSQLNGVRLPSADAETRAVELDQFPASVIESVQVSKTFTPDQQGDASGGAVNVVLKGLPDETVFRISGQVSYNTNAGGRSDFLTYEGSSLGTFGNSGGNPIQTGLLGSNWQGAVGASTRESPPNFKMSGTLGGRRELNDDWTVGGFASLFYERDSSFYDDGIDDSYWVVGANGQLVPRTSQGSVGDGDFKTNLFDVTRAGQTVQWGGVGGAGLETENSTLSLTVMHTQTADDTVTLAEDTRGKAYYFPGYDPNDPMGVGNDPSSVTAAPYLRTQTLEYAERTTTSVQLHGEHVLTQDGWGPREMFGRPEFDWTLASSSADAVEPDKRQFGSLWRAASFNPGIPGILPPFTSPATYFQYKPSANFNQGNLQRTFERIAEDSDQFSLNLKLPFEQWAREDGYLKFGLFQDRVKRRFDQETFSNFGDSSASLEADFSVLWTDTFPFENHPITAGTIDVDYRGDQELLAYYGMVDLPLRSDLSLITGARVESTEIGIAVFPEADALWFPPGNQGNAIDLNPGDADVAFSQRDVLPSVGLVYEPWEEWTFRAAYSRTVARQTFRELSPILQQEYLGGPVFIGNPELRMSSLENFDLRADYAPYEGSLVSASYFLKNIDDPIEFVQRIASFDYTTVVNYPKGRLSGFEFEVRQDLGRFWSSMRGVSAGLNATFIDSEVVLPDAEAAGFNLPNINAPLTKRDATKAPDRLYNLYATYDLADYGTSLGLFYTLTGDTLVAGAAQLDSNFIPNVYAEEFGNLNFSLSQQLGGGFALRFQAKNLTDPRIKQVYRSPYIDEELTRTSFTRGREFSISLSASF